MGGNVVLVLVVVLSRWNDEVVQPGTKRLLTQLPTTVVLLFYFAGSTGLPYDEIVYKSPPTPVPPPPL